MNWFNYGRCDFSYQPVVSEPKQSYWIKHNEIYYDGESDKFIVNMSFSNVPDYLFYIGEYHSLSEAQAKYDHVYRKALARNYEKTKEKEDAEKKKIYEWLKCL